MLLKKTGLIWLLLWSLLQTKALSQQWEHRILQTVHTNRSTSLDPLAKGFSYSAYPVAIAYPLTELLLDKQPEKPRLERFFILSGGLVVESAFSYGLKWAFNRERPFEMYDDVKGLVEVSSQSFPSNHTGAAFHTATLMSLEHPKWYVMAPAALWAGGVAWSRMHLGIHHPTDVLAGMAIGVGTGWLTHYFQKWYLKKDRVKWRKNSTKSAPGSG